MSLKGAHQTGCEYANMKKNSTYEIGGDLYEFNNDRLKKIIQSQNPNRGAYEQFYRKVVSLGAGISYDAVKGWVKNNTNPALEDVKVIAGVLGIDYMKLLDCTHYSADAVNTRLQKITFTEVLDSFSLRYEGFSNVLDMIIGMGYDPATEESKVSDFAERIIGIVREGKPKEAGLPELLGYKFVYSEEDLRNMSEAELLDAINTGYVDGEGNSLYDNNHRIALDRATFGKRLVENASWLEPEEMEELREVVGEADKWWDFCDMPFALLKIDINAFGQNLASYTYGMGWARPTHKDRWQMLLDVLNFLGLQVDLAGLCWISEIHVDQLESEMFLTIDVCR